MKKVIKVSTLSIFLGLAAGLLFNQSIKAQFIPDQPEVLFTDGPGAATTNLFQSNINELLAAINASYKEEHSILETVGPNVFRGDDGEFGYSELMSLFDETGFYITEEAQTGRIYELVDGNYEVRQIFVELGIEVEKEEHKSQELILSLSPDGVIYGARFALPQHRFDQILGSSRSFEDEFRRMQIVNYLERFRTAYNRKDVDFIEQQFSEQALIITGTRIEPATDRGSLEPNEGYQEQFRFLRQNKEEYITRLRTEIFARNEFINIEFDDIEIVEHPYYEEVYGINLFQIWDSSTYSDEGYLFLMIDYEDETQPLIYVRAWQPEPFDDGTVIDIDMFNLVK